MTLSTIDKDKFFRGGANITPDPDAGKELGELIYDIQVAVNLVENGIVDGDFAGTDLGRLTRTGAGAYAVIKDNLAGAVAPAVSDDADDGYGVGSLWFDTTAHRLYTCTDATAGAAVWIGMVAKNNVAAVAPTVNDDVDLGYSVGSMWFDTTIVPPRAYLCTDATDGAAVWRQINPLDNLAATVAPTVNDDVTAGYDVGSKWLDTTADTAYICLDSTTGAAVWSSIDVTAVSVAAATAVMDGDFAGATAGAMVRTGAGAYVVIQHNLAAAVAPTVNDDTTGGYAIGSLWLDTTAHRMYICTDATGAAAVWVGQVAKNNVAAAAPVAAVDDDSLGYSIGSVWTDTATGIVWLCQSAATGAAVWNPLVKCNFAAAVGPTVNEDTGDGYAVGSIWINTTAVPPTVFQCVDATTGAAVWRQINQLNNLAAAVAPVAGDDVADGYDVGSIWIDTVLENVFICIDPAAGVAVWRNAMARTGDFPGEQAVLADATIRTWIAPGAGHIVAAYARVATAHTGNATNEQSDVDVLKNAVSIFDAGTPTIVLDAAALTNAIAGVLSAVPGVIDFVAGDIFTIYEDYTLDGTGGDTGANLAVVVQYELD